MAVNNLARLRALDEEIDRRYPASNLRPRDVHTSLPYCSTDGWGTLVPWGDDWIYVAINEQLADFNGASVREHLGVPLGKLIPEFEGTVMPILAKVRATGIGVYDFALHATTRSYPTQRDWLVTYEPVTGPDDEVLAIVVLVREP